MNRQHVFLLVVSFLLGILVLVPTTESLSQSDDLAKASLQPVGTLSLCRRCSPTPTRIKLSRPTPIPTRGIHIGPTGTFSLPRVPGGRATKTPPPSMIITPTDVQLPQQTQVPMTGIPVLHTCLPAAVIIMQRNHPASGNSDIVSYDPVAKTEVVLTANFPGKNTHPSLAPDGCQMVFSHAATTTDSADLYVMPMAGGAMRQITNTPAISEVQPIWSRLNSIVYAVPDGDLFSTDQLGSLSVDLGVKGDSPQTSPDGQWVLFKRTDTPNKEIAVVSILGRTSGFYNLGVQGDNPRWDSIGHNIYVQATGGIVSLEFGKPTSLLTAGATDISVNPTGNGAAVLIVGDQLWLVPTLVPIGAAQQLTQPGSDLLTSTAPEWWDPKPISTDMAAFMQYLQLVGPAS